MCGLFGFVAKRDGPLNMDVLKRVASVTMRRGPHSWGMAWIDSRGRMKMYKQAGRIVDALGLLSMARDARLMIGHCRFATHGDPENNLNNHPHPCDGGWIVHNGVVTQYKNIADEFDLYRVTDCDSEVLGLLIESLDGDLLKRCVTAAKRCKGTSPLAMLGLWPDRIVAIRANNQPLHVGETSRGYYLGSLAEGLPGAVRELEDNIAIEMGED